MVSSSNGFGQSSSLYLRKVWGMKGVWGIGAGGGGLMHAKEGQCDLLRPVNVMRSPRGFRNRTIMCTTQRCRARNCPIPDSIGNCITFTNLNECCSLDVDNHVTIFTKKPLNTPTPYKQILIAMIFGVKFHTLWWNNTCKVVKSPPKTINLLPDLFVFWRQDAVFPFFGFSYGIFYTLLLLYKFLLILIFFKHDLFSKILNDKTCVFGGNKPQVPSNQSAT